MKNADFADMSHHKFETVKNRGPPNVLVPGSKEEPTLLQTEEMHHQVFMTQDGRTANLEKSGGVAPVK